MRDAGWIVPEWPAPGRVQALMTTRSGGVSLGPYASLNLGLKVNDDPQAVAANRARLREALLRRAKANRKRSCSESVCSRARGALRPGLSGWKILHGEW